MIRRLRDYPEAVGYAALLPEKSDALLENLFLVPWTDGPAPLRLGLHLEMPDVVEGFRVLEVKDRSRAALANRRLCEAGRGLPSIAKRQLTSGDWIISVNRLAKRQDMLQELQSNRDLLIVTWRFF
mmetsp:Transcript_51127/g.119212  ORF Transcript_51127/g.119212 Transcript_51127/m.119212 type:complete len:126 (+) Transcript_51127:40-417(+)